MYKAYYALRDDGDGDLITVIQDRDLVDERIVDSVTAETIKTLTIFTNYFVRENGVCDFPDVWDVGQELNNEVGFSTNHDPKEINHG
jgi:hypothetical protein